MIRVDYYDYGRCCVKFFKTAKDVDSFRRHIAADRSRFTLLYINLKRV